MKTHLFQIDAFTDRIFGGNPACVVPLNEWLPDHLLLNIAKENSVAETAFFIFIPGTHKIPLRWFTPEIEMDLCGHATLAAAHSLKTILGYERDRMIFSTKSSDITVTEEGGIYSLNLPARKPVPGRLPKPIEDALSIRPKQVLKSRDYVLVYKSESDIRNIKIDRHRFDQVNLDPGGVVITAKGDHCDFVSRFFTPQASIFEDPVTGSAHCSLIPYWSEKLGKKKMDALQLSARNGKIFCIDKGERVVISGRAKTYLIGTIWTE
jgi:PhzF family phenazine biosynthesis protein